MSGNGACSTANATCSKDPLKNAAGAETSRGLAVWSPRAAEGQDASVDGDEPVATAGWGDASPTAGLWSARLDVNRVVMLVVGFLGDGTSEAVGA
jgi:hypothetical protein